MAQDRMMNEQLPLLALQAKNQITSPANSLTRLSQEREIDNEFMRRRIVWSDKMIEWEIKTYGVLMELRKEYGMDDQKLAAECSRILLLYPHKK